MRVSSVRYLILFVYVFCTIQTSGVRRRKIPWKKVENEDSNSENVTFSATAAVTVAAVLSSVTTSADIFHGNAIATPTVYINRQTRPFQILHPKPPDVSIECAALRSKRYISDGFCTSIKPVSDVVCTGNCLPIRDLPWYAEFIKVWSRQKTLQYRCVDDLVRQRKVTFMCQNGETRTYDIRVVRSCQCKRYIRNQNESPQSTPKNKKQN